MNNYQMRFRAMYYDWHKLRKIDPNAQWPTRAFNVGQWFGTAGVVKREEFDPWVDGPCRVDFGIPSYSWAVIRGSATTSFFEGSDRRVGLIDGPLCAGRATGWLT